MSTPTAKELHPEDSWGSFHSRWWFYAGFVLPIVFNALITIPFDNAAASGPTSKVVVALGWIIINAGSVLLSTIARARSEQRWMDRIVAAMLTIVTWLLVQICAFVVLAILLIAMHGLAGIQ